MEAFSLLKYWRAGGGAGGATTTVPDSITNAKAATKTIVAAAAVSPYSSDGEDGPYFDLEFALPDQESDTDEQTSAESQENDVKREDEDETESEEEIPVHHSDEDDDEEEEEEAELKFSLTSNECTDQNAALSPSDDLFFKGDLVSIEPSGILLNTAEENSKFPIFLVKSATKFRVLLLKLKKSKSVNGENTETAEKPETAGQASPTPPKAVERESQGKLSGKFFVKFKVEEVPLVNLFTRDNSSKENHGKAPKQSVQDSDTNSASDERKLSKEVVHKYLKMVKPFYIRVSKRYVEKLKFPGHSGGGSKGVCAAAPPPEVTATAAPINVKSSHPKPGNNLQAGLKVVRKHLGKSRSASAAAAAAAPPPAKVVSDRRDDSLLQLQDGIQGAILHCKKSFNAPRDVESQSSIFCRSVSDPSYQKSIMKPKFSRAPSSTSTSGEAKKGIS